MTWPPLPRFPVHSYDGKRASKPDMSSVLGAKTERDEEGGIDIYTIEPETSHWRTAARCSGDDGSERGVHSMVGDAR